VGNSIQFFRKAQGIFAILNGIKSDLTMDGPYVSHAPEGKSNAGVKIWEGFLLPVHAMDLR